MRQPNMPPPDTLCTGHAANKLSQSLPFSASHKSLKPAVLGLPFTQPTPVSSLSTFCIYIQFILPAENLPSSSIAAKQRNMPANVLFERDTNLPQAATTNSKPQGEKKPMSMEYHRQVLESRMKNGECVFQTSRSSGSDCSSSSRVQSLSNSHHHRQQQTYVSPSDNIQSPATQKLAAFKNKRLDKRYVCNLRPLLPLSVGIELT